MDIKGRNVFASENVYINRMKLIDETTGKLNVNLIPVTYLENKGVFTRNDIDKGKISLSVTAHDVVLMYKDHIHSYKNMKHMTVGPKHWMSEDVYYILTCDENAIVNINTRKYILRKK